MATDKDTELKIDEQGDGSAIIVDPTHVAEHHGDEPDEGQHVDDDAPADGAHVGEEVGDLTDPEREAIRARRRQERQEKKQAQRQREDGLRSELAQERYARMQLEQAAQDMAARLGQLEQHRASSDLAGVDASIKRASDTASYYKQVIADATAKQDGTAAAEAMERMIAARQEADRLTQLKQQHVQRVQQRPQASAPLPLPREAADKGRDWIQRNPWYRPNGGDPDSSRVLQIDSALMQMGYDPKSDEYWKALDARVAELLPHRANSSYTADTTARGKPASRTPVTGSGRESSSGAQGADGQRSGTYTLSPARVQALKDAGMWSDPKLRAEAIRSFRDYDRAHRA